MNNKKHTLVYSKHTVAEMSQYLWIISSGEGVVDVLMKVLLRKEV
jgi:hypothetical protein